MISARLSMKILYIAPKFYDGNPKQGLGYEHHNLYGTLVRMSPKNEVHYFPFDEIMVAKGREKMNQLLIQKIKECQPEICFFFLRRDEIDKNTLKRISSSDRATTFNWFGDDYSRFDSFSRFYAPFFDWVCTTDQKSVKKYEQIGCRNVIKTQWACNHFLYHPSKMGGYAHDVSFVGQNYSSRSALAEKIGEAGHKVDCYGRGWPNGRISQRALMDTFSRSKINLNLNDTPSSIKLRYIVGILFHEHLDGRITLNPLQEWLPLARSLLWQRKHLKARTFEIPGCRGFMLTQYTEGVEEYYTDDKEIATFKNDKELIDKINDYLNDSKKREKIALAGYRRTIKEHTYEKRFKDIFKAMGF